MRNASKRVRVCARNPGTDLSKPAVVLQVAVFFVEADVEFATRWARHKPALTDVLQVLLWWWWSGEEEVEWF